MQSSVHYVFMEKGCILCDPTGLCYRNAPEIMTFDYSDFNAITDDNLCDLFHVHNIHHEQ